MNNTSTENSPEHSQRRKMVRPWIFGALFVWALTGAVALSTLSSRATSPAPKAAQEPVVAAAPNSALPDASDTLVPIPASGGKIAWEGSFESAMQRARVEKKPIMVNFYTDWCGWCKELDSKVFPDETVVSESKNWVSVKINAEKRPDVAGAYGVTGFPTTIFAQGSGKPVEVLSGFAPPAEFVAAMRAAREKSAL
jgi:thiol:disulfide interchange protein